MQKMKVVKLTKQDLKKHPADILKKVGAVDKNRGNAYPIHVYMSKKDLDAVETNLRKSLKKANPRMPKQALDRSVDFVMADFGPNTYLQDVMASGIAAVDVESLNKDLNAAKTIAYKVTYVKLSPVQKLMQKLVNGTESVIEALKFQNRA
jgi:hypothetical protein